MRAASGKSAPSSAATEHWFMAVVAVSPVLCVIQLALTFSRAYHALRVGPERFSCNAARGDLSTALVGRMNLLHLFEHEHVLARPAIGVKRKRWRSKGYAISLAGDEPDLFGA